MAAHSAKDESVISQRIIIRHLSGSRANQVEDFPIDQFQEVNIGRTATAHIKYDPDQDDLVSREHARITLDDQEALQFTIHDLNSRNGILVNKQKVLGMAKIRPTDVIQLGLGGPEFEFDLDPRPDNMMRKTRFAEGTEAYTSERPTQASEVAVAPVPTVGGTDTHRPIGKATVERLVTQSQKKSRNYVFMGGGILLLLIIVIVGLFSQNIMGIILPKITNIEREITEQQANQPLTPNTIGATYSNATVFLEVGWVLINAQTGKQVYHQYVQLKDEKGKPMVNGQGQPIYKASFQRLADGSIEPLLTEDDTPPNRPVGGRHTGSGFVVKKEGFILTNRHVAATWMTSYQFPEDAFPGVICVRESDGRLRQSAEVLLQDMSRWVPAESQMFGERPISGKIFEGRNDYMDVTFAKNELRIPAQIVRVSNRHDVAMLKIETPETLHEVELFDNYDSIAIGNKVTVLGYPGLSPQVGVTTKSQDVLNRQNNFVAVPDPTLTAGHISRVIRGEVAPLGRTVGDYYSSQGDTYQLDINATGHGNSGGPVFDEKGKVIAIFTAGKWGPGEAISFATPIRFALELLGTQEVL